ncbi:MAG: glycosyltransferase family 39 protein [Acidobacteriota bacterium]
MDGDETSFRRWRTALVLALVSIWYFAATLPYLSDFPLLGWAQMGIVAPAAKLAEDGVYGNDLFTGFHRSEDRNYEYMPAYPLLVAGSFEVFGLGVWPARLVSVFCGWLTLLLVFQLGRQLYGAATGLLAAMLLVTLRVGLLPNTSGVALLDFARLIRYDILVPVGVLGACCCFLWAMRRTSPRVAIVGFVAAGALAGLATLAHVYGGFILAVLASVLLWQHGWRVLRSAAPYFIALGWLLAMLPWIVYVLQDWPAYVGQMSRHAGRFELFDLGFYWHNLQREPWRYAAWSGGGFAGTFLRPRVGIWLVLALVPASTWVLWRRNRDGGGTLADRFLLVSLPILALCLALLIALKRYYYIVLVLPFIALQVAFLVEKARQWAMRRGGPARYVVPVVLALVVVEAGVGILQIRKLGARTTPYLELSEAIARSIPRGSKLLITQPWWLGLRHFGHQHLRSVNLVFLYRSQTIETVMASLAPDFVVIEELFLDPQSSDPRASGNPQARRSFQELRSYLAETCASDVTRIPSSDYGAILIYDCR